MKIFYWSPFLSNIATVDSVINSIKSINIMIMKRLTIIALLENGSKKLDNHEFNVRQLYITKFYFL